ncbi:MAG TPA: D-alanyl-D-alanine endopeptidase [Steroidobacter sp.]
MQIFRAYERWLAVAGCFLIGLGSAKASHAPGEPDHAPKASGLSSPAGTEQEASVAKTRAPSLKPDVRSSAVVVMDAADSSILYARNSTQPLPIASITKLMTALVVLESGEPLEETIEIQPEDCELEKPVYSRLTPGTRLTREELLRLALMSSENRAAQALARAHPGGLTAFVREMNAKARELGMKTARFAEPTGLSSHNVSSAKDLVKLVRAAAENPLIAQFSTEPHYTVVTPTHVLEYRNTNTLVEKPDWTIQVQKTGYTNAAGRCLVMQALIEERPIVMVLLNSFGKYTRVADARRIRRWLESTQPDTQLAGTDGVAAPAVSQPTRSTTGI